MKNIVSKKFIELLKKRSEIEITIIGRKSGREITLPVWFVLEKNRIFLLPVYGSRTNWYKNVVVNPSIKIRVDNLVENFIAKPSFDKNIVREIIDGFKEKYGENEIKKWYSGFDAAVIIDLK